MDDHVPLKWKISAPEAQVLLTGPDTPELWAIKLAYKDLAARGALSVRSNESRDWLLRKRENGVFIRNNISVDAFPRPLVAALEVLPRPTVFLGAKQGIPIDRATRDVLSWYRLAGGYVAAEVLPSLEQRGLYERMTPPQRARWQLTQEGTTVHEAVRETVDRGRTEFPSGKPIDVERAFDWVLDAGFYTLLIEDYTNAWPWTILRDLIESDAGGIPTGAGTGERSEAHGRGWTIEVDGTCRQIDDSAHRGAEDSADGDGE